MLRDSNPSSITRITVDAAITTIEITKRTKDIFMSIFCCGVIAVHLLS